MGNGASSERSSHFQPQQSADEDAAAAARAPTEPAAAEADEPTAPLISISNKIVERLVDDNAIYKETATKSKKELVQQEKIFIERLRSIDEKHTERLGLLPEDLDALIGRVQLRAAKLPHVETVCGDCEVELLDCYANNEDKTLCSGEIINFQRCVKEQATERLRNRIADMEDEQVRKSRDLEKARKHNFWGNLEPQKTKT